MKQKLLYAAWGCLYILCVALGFVKNPAGFGKVLLVLTGIIFFLPGAWLLRDGLMSGHRKTVKTVRVIAICSLTLTLLLLVLNFMSLRWNSVVGDRLFELLSLVSAPMLCCQYWVLSLFLWACLLVASFKRSKTDHGRLKASGSNSTRSS